ncbi:MAG: hypothetical protein JJ863_15005 [Deltaproteobacteria bacterium]|nr:hypothetical protein [Deltaproteobacteria bacterium]
MTRTRSWAGRRVMVVAAYDSFLKSGLAYARHFESLGAQLSFRLLRTRENQISPAQLEALGLKPGDVVARSLEALTSRAELDEQDVILLALNGLRSRRFLARFHSAFAKARRRPMVVSFYPGLIFRFHLEGMTSRMGADLLALNSPSDLALYERMLAFMGVDNQNAVALGLSFLPTRAEAAARIAKPNGPIVFIAQPTVPASRAERRYVLERWIALARRHPERQWLFKPRHRREETTLHRVAHHFEEILKELTPPPANFGITHTPVAKLLDEASAFVTFSSTAALEAACLEIPVRVLTDLGVHENIGNHFFIGSGLEATFDDIRPGLAFRLDPDWAKLHVRSARDHLDLLDQRLEALLSSREDSDVALPAPQSRLFGRTSDFDAWLSEREGANAVAEFGAKPKSSVWKRLRQRTRPLRSRAFAVVRRLRSR